MTRINAHGFDIEVRENEVWIDGARVLSRGIAPNQKRDIYIEVKANDPLREEFGKDNRFRYINLHFDGYQWQLYWWRNVPDDGAQEASREVFLKALEEYKSEL